MSNTVETATIRQLRAELAEVMEALDKSVSLQAHYARLLNMHDGINRMIFHSGRAWIERLRELAAVPQSRNPDV